MEGDGGPTHFEDSHRNRSRPFGRGEGAGTPVGEHSQGKKTV